MSNFVHACHVLSLNSGFSTSLEFEKFFTFAEELALKKIPLLNLPTLDLDKLSLISQHIDQEIKKYAQENLSKTVFFHGGGTIYEYAVLCKLLNKTVLNITVHEPRNNFLLYPGEEILLGVPRGKWALENIIIAKNWAKNYEQNLGLKINFYLERENFGNSDLAQKLKLFNQPYYQYFDGHILSTHNLPLFNKSSEADQYFIDGDINDFIKLLANYGFYHHQTDSLIPIILAYIAYQKEHVQTNGQENFILGHCDLIISAIYRGLSLKMPINEAINRIKQDYSHPQVQAEYLNLCQLLKLKNMKLELNLAGRWKNFAYYGELLLEVIKQSQVDLVLSSDSHSIAEEIIANELKIR